MLVSVQTKTKFTHDKALFRKLEKLQNGETYALCELLTNRAYNDAGLIPRYCLGCSFWECVNARLDETVDQGSDQRQFSVGRRNAH